MDFEWDPGKAKSNLRKHEVAFEEAVTVFADPLAVVFPDRDHSLDEHRELIIGHSAQHRLMIVSFTERIEQIRIISARLATARERRDYEENPFLG